MNKRKALIGYSTFWLGRRLTERIVRRQVKRRISALLGQDEPSTIRQTLPMAGVAAAIGAAAAIIVTRPRS